MKMIRTTLKTLSLIFAAALIVVTARTWYISGSGQPDAQTLSSPPVTFNEKAALTHFAKAITFKTISSETAAINGDEFQKLHQYLKQTYPQVFTQLDVQTFGKHGLLLTWQGRDKTRAPVLYMAHQDIVPISPGTENNWQHPPFDGVIADGYVWGRGALDCKASLMALFETTSLLLDKQFTPKRTVYFYFGDDEESGGRSAALASSYFHNKNIRMEYVIDEGGLVANDMFRGVKSTVALIGVAEKGYLNLELSANAAGGHSSLPPKQTAIGDISIAISKLLKRPFPIRIHGVTKDFLENLATDMSLPNKILLTNIWLFEPVILEQIKNNTAMNAMLHTTEAPTIFNAGTKSNVLPIQASAIINFRIDPYESVASVTKHVTKAINNPDIKITPLLNWEPSPVSSTESAGYRLLYSAIKKSFGDKTLVTPFLLTGATDSRQFTSVADNVYRFNPNIVINKDDIARFHGTDERYATQNYMKTLQFYYDLLSQE